MNGGDIGVHENMLENLRGGSNVLKVHWGGGGSDNILGYLTSDMHVNTMVQQHNGLGGGMKNSHESGGVLPANRVHPLGLPN